MSSAFISITHQKLLLSYTNNITDEKIMFSSFKRNVTIFMQQESKSEYQSWKTNRPVIRWCFLFFNGKIKFPKPYKNYSVIYRALNIWKISTTIHELNSETNLQKQKKNSNWGIKNISHFLKLSMTSYIFVFLLSSFFSY